MRICIVGVGLLGGSFALGVKSVDDSHHFIGVDTNEKHVQQALELGIVDETKYFTQAMATADLIVLATPVSVILKQLQETLDHIKPGSVVIDLGSTKESFCKAVADHPNRGQYVACHPIAGTENSGPEAAFSTLLKHKQLIICDKEKSSKEALALVEPLFKKLEMHLSFMRSEDHDRHIAYVSHLSHISSFALGLTVLEKEKDEKSIFEMAGSGFSSTVRLAKSSPDMWAPIFTQNTSNISKALDAYIKLLQEFRDVIDKQEEAKSYALMQKANEIGRILHGLDK